MCIRDREYNDDDDYKLIVYYSQNKALQDKQTREKRFNKAEAALGKLIETVSKRKKIDRDKVVVHAHKILTLLQF